MSGKTDLRDEQRLVLPVCQRKRKSDDNNAPTALCLQLECVSELGYALCSMSWYALSATEKRCGGISVRRFPRYLLITFSV